MNTTRYNWKATLVLLALSVLFVAPFLWMLSASFKHEAAIFPPPGEPARWLPSTDLRDAQGRLLVNYQGRQAIDLEETDEAGRHRLLVDGREVVAWADEVQTPLRPGLHWANYVRAFSMMDFWRNLRNTLFICLTAVLGTLASCALVAYGFARIPWRGRKAVFVLVLATMMVPYQVTLIPMFALYSKLGWTGSFLPLVVPYFLGTPFYIFLLVQFFRGIPEELSDAARIDGCSEFGIFWRIILPLSRPALATTALFMFLFQWGDFLNPLVYLQDSSQYTLALSLQQFQSQHESAWGPLMAMATVITLPVITLSGLKG
jgi:multiple sugar transport system permease protein